MIKIITTVLRRHPHSVKPELNNNVNTLSKQQRLQKLAESINIKLTPSIIDQDQQHPKPRILSHHKHEMGLFIPKSPFNHRLSRRSQSQYLPEITKNLYKVQRQELTSYLRILQTNIFLHHKKLTLDYYINLIYKDVYARYLISKGVGVEWDGFYADVGVTNEFATKEYQKDSQFKENYNILIDFIRSQATNINKSKTIGLYDYSLKQFVHSSQMNVESIKKMGYYIKEELTQFGSFKDQFQILQQKNAKIYLLIFVEQLQKLINPNAIVLSSNSDFYILKRFTPDTNNNLSAEYLMVPKNIYNNHQKYFKDMKYQKNSLFNSKYLLGMKIKDLPIIAEIEGYEREQGAYIVNSGCHLSDFQRINQHKLSHNRNYADQNGMIWINNQNTGISLLDIKANKLLEDKLKQLYNFMDFFDVFDDELYYQKQTNRLLKFRISDRYSIELPYNASSIILEGLKQEGAIVAESKISIPGPVEGKKPKQRRAFRKKKKELKKQLTEHYTLAESLESISSISISTLSPSLYKICLFLKDDAVVSFQQALEDSQLDHLMQTGLLPHDTITRIKSQGYLVVEINANDNLTKCLAYLKNLTSSKEIFNIIIEPQSQTDELIPFSLHLNYLINKGKNTRRRIEKGVKTNINLIKLHPTFEQEIRELDVFTIIHGVIKSNQKQQYGMGFEALRLWTAKNDNYLGDRNIDQTQINKELKHSQFIRKTFWQLLSLLPQRPPQSDITPSLYLSKFILDSMDCYISHMQQCYKYMNLHKAYELTLDFFENILDEIYVKSIRKHIINYPNHSENQEHFWVIRRVMELAAVIAPLFPFSAYHISRNQLLKWPTINNPKFYENLKMHNEMIRIRVKIINKLRLNRLTHAHLHAQTLKDNFSERDLQLFLNIDKVTIKRPEAYKRQCSLRLSKHNKVTEDQRLTFYINDDHCLRCDSHSNQTSHFCSKCLEYMQEQVGEPLKYFAFEQLTEGRTNDVV